MCEYSHVHSKPLGSGFSSQIALILPAGTNPGLHLKNISAPSVVLWYALMYPFPGRVGSLQLTGETGMEVQLENL